MGDDDFNGDSVDTVSGAGTNGAGSKPRNAKRLTIT